jgi:hypothetical protein
MVRGMTFTAKVHNQTITVPSDLRLAEGAEVLVTVTPETPLEEATPGWLQRSTGTATSGLGTDEIMRLTRGED